MKPLLKPTDYLNEPPNPDPNTFHRKWTDWPEIHDQESLDKTRNYLLRMRGAIPKGGNAFWIKQTHPLDGGDVRMTQDPAMARSFKGIYLLRTMWDWERRFEAELI